MESYKDVIVSQPPAMYGKLAYTANISLENYKGILLCDRPTQLAPSASDGMDSSGGKSFCPAGRTGNPVGYGPTLESRSVRENNLALRAENFKRNRNQTREALTKHRRWLRSFANQMKSMRQVDIDREVEAAQRAARLRQQEKKQLQEQQEVLRKERQLLVEKLETREHSMPSPQQQKLPNDIEKRAKKPGTSSKKPRWAMTEDEAFDDELMMHDDLLAFAGGLDYDKFITDYEVKEALFVMKDRVLEIAKANNWTAEDLQFAATQEDAEDDLQSTVAGSDVLPSTVPRPAAGGSPAAAPSEARHAIPCGVAAHDKDWDSGTGKGRMLKRAISKDALALADRLLATSPSMQRVYTKQSLARVLQKFVLQGQMDVSETMLLALRGNKDAGNPAEANAGASLRPPESLSDATRIGPDILEPVVMTVAAEAFPAVQPHEERRVLLEAQRSRERTQGLPYLYRCPAI